MSKEQAMGKTNAVCILLFVIALGFPRLETVSADGWFQEYGNIPWEEEQALLGSFAIALKKNPNMIGYIGFRVGKKDKIENGWKGILVLQTTRDEVEKILGKPAVEDGKITYQTDDALVHIDYSSSPCSNTKSYRGNYKMPQNTVIRYKVYLKKEIKLSVFEWQSDLYEKYEDKHSLRYIYYSNRKNGIIITTVKLKEEPEIVEAIEFEPTKEQNAIYRCENE